jgi:hypothetical protein
VVEVVAPVRPADAAEGVVDPVNVVDVVEITEDGADGGVAGVVDVVCGALVVGFDAVRPPPLRTFCEAPPVIPRLRKSPLVMARAATTIIGTPSRRPRSSVFLAITRGCTSFFAVTRARTSRCTRPVRSAISPASPAADSGEGWSADGVPTVSIVSVDVAIVTNCPTSPGSDGI